MKFTSLWMVAPLVFSLTLTSCNKDDKSDKSDSNSFARFLWTESVITEPQFTIINQYGERINGAQILIGDAQDVPFRNNFLTTDSTGTALAPSEWVEPASVTVDAEGYIRQTLLNVKPGNLTIKLNAAYLSQRAEVRGQVTQLPVVNGDKLIDFSLVMPAVSKEDLLNFDIGQVISPYSDTLSAAGQSNDIPSNISLPRQNESYFINVTLDKPVYRLKSPTLGPKKLVTTRGRFVFKTVVNELRNGKPFHELINYFSILGGSIRETAIAGPQTNLDIPGNEIEFRNALNVSSPSIKSDELLLVLATNKIDNSMIPTDVKRAANGQATKLQTMGAESAHIVRVVKKTSEFMSQEPGTDRMSASLLPFSANGGQLLPLIANPTITSTDNYTINLPTPPTTSGINPIATTASISDLVEVQDGNKRITIPNRKWEVFGLGWNQQIKLPKWPLNNLNGRKRVEVNYVGSTSNKRTNFDDSLIENATHITHASADF